MGQEVSARVTFGDSVSEGKALLETSELLFRGDFRLRIPFGEIQDLQADTDRLFVEWPGGRAVFELGSRYAGPWAEKIRHPRGLLDKLGVRPGAKVSVIGVEDEAFLAQLRERTGDVRLGDAQAESDLLFCLAAEVEDLMRLADLRPVIKESGAIWAVSPKGKGSKVKDVDVIEAAKAAGLVDTKVVSFSDTHTALKLVVPLALRAKGKTSAKGPAP